MHHYCYEFNRFNELFDYYNFILTRSQEKSKWKTKKLNIFHKRLLNCLVIEFITYGLLKFHLTLKQKTRNKPRFQGSLIAPTSRESWDWAAEEAGMEFWEDIYHMLIV